MKEKFNDQLKATIEDVPVHIGDHSWMQELEMSREWVMGIHGLGIHVMSDKVTYVSSMAFLWEAHFSNIKISEGKQKGLEISGCMGARCTQKFGCAPKFLKLGARRAPSNFSRVINWLKFDFFLDLTHSWPSKLT